MKNLRTVSDQLTQEITMLKNRLEKALIVQSSFLVPNIKEPSGSEKADRDKFENKLALEE